MSSNSATLDYYFNTSLFDANAIGTPGTASRHAFHGPRAVHVDLALLRSFRFQDRRSLQLSLETFNTLNRAQFFGPAAVNGD